MVNATDRTKSATIKNFIILTVFLAIALGIVYCVRFLGILISSYVVMTVIFCIASILLGILFGLVIGLNSYEKKEDAKSIVYARPKPLRIASLSFILPGVAFLVMFVLKLMEREARPTSFTEDELAPVFLGMAICALVFSIFVQIGISMATCPQCGAFRSYVEDGKSDVKTTTRTESKDVTYSGASYDVYDSSGAHVGTARGSDSHAKLHRTITTHEWNVYCKCVFCGRTKNVKESKTEKSKWE